MCNVEDKQRKLSHKFNKVHTGMALKIQALLQFLRTFQAPLKNSTTVFKDFQVIKICENSISPMLGYDDR